MLFVTGDRLAVPLVLETAFTDEQVCVHQVQARLFEIVKGGSISAAWTMPTGFPATARPTDNGNPRSRTPFTPSVRVNLSGVRLTKLIYVLALTQMTVRVRWDAIALYSLDSSPYIAA